MKAPGWYAILFGHFNLIKDTKKTGEKKQKEEKLTAQIKYMNQ